MACISQKNVVFKERLKRPYAVTRLTAHFMSGLMSDLVICNFRKSMFTHDTERPVWYHGTTQTQPIPGPILILMIILYTFSEEAQLNHLTGKQEMA